MKTLRRSSFAVITSLFILSAGLLFAQDQDSYPAPAPPPSDASVQQPAYPGQAGQPQDQGYPDRAGAGQQQDPPGRVARVQYMSGEVSMQPGGANDWIAASQNRPLTTADRIWTDKNSRAELNVGDGFIRMNAETSLTLTNVSDGSVQLELDQGTLEVSVRHLAPGEIYEVDTPNYAFTVTKSGVYRFDVYPSEDQSWVTVRNGSGQATGNGSAVRVNSGQQVRFSSGNSLQHVAESAPARDGFDDWVQVRDKRLESSLSARYVSPGVIGYQDLDGYGRWVPAPQYGNVWVPNSVPSGWAPYRYGHWVWIAPWGWTWVDDQPWGFAPFHYGRWVTYGGGWAWAPGPVGYWNPYYSPALVGWIGGPGFGVGIGFGGGFSIGINFGWFPLGWGEPYYPRYAGWGQGGWYHGGGYVSNNYIRNVNVTNTHITNITNVTNNYYNGNVGAAHYGFRNTPGAVTAAPQSAFASGAAINRVGGAVPKADLGRGNVLRGVNVNPTREAVLGGHTAQTRGVPPASAFSRPVVTANRPANIRPANIEAANQATAAHNNNVGAPAGQAAVRGPNNGPGAVGANNGRVGNGTPQSNGSGVASSVPSARGTANANAARSGTDTPTSMGGHYVPRPPSAGGSPTPGVRSGAAGANSTPANNGNFGRANGNNAGSAETRPPSAYGAPRTGGTVQSGAPQTYGAERGGTVNSAPRPPQTYEPGRPVTASPSRPAAQSAPAQSAPAHESTPAHESSHGDSSRGPGSAMNVPRPPAAYSYHPAPSYTASAGSEASRPMSGYGATSRGSYSQQPSYSAPSRSSSPTYSAPSRGSTPTYSAPSRGSTPTYSAPNRSSTPTYSAPSRQSAPVYSSRNSGSYSAARAPSGGGGSYHAPSSGGSHSSGGGSHASSSGNGGGNHGK